MKDKLYKLMNWPEIEAIIYSEDDNPHRLLGPHKAGSSVVFQTFQPGAERVELVFPDAGKELEMELADEAGYFAVLIPGRSCRKGRPPQKNSLPMNTGLPGRTGR